jgi:hypothetical protein
MSQWHQRPNLLIFRRPDPEVMSRIREILSALEVSPKNGGGSEQGREPDMMGSLDALISGLEGVLQASYRKGLLATENQPWTFEYVVQAGAGEPTCIEILTRLYDPTRPGNIFFGRRIRRVSEKEYAAWIDD